MSIRDFSDISLSEILKLIVILVFWVCDPSYSTSRTIGQSDLLFLSLIASVVMTIAVDYLMPKFKTSKRPGKGKTPKPIKKLRWRSVLLSLVLYGISVPLLNDWLSSGSKVIVQAEVVSKTNDSARRNRPSYWRLKLKPIQDTDGVNISMKERVGIKYDNGFSLVSGVNVELTLQEGFFGYYVVKDVVSATNSDE